jgi:hypothetical protein
VHLHNILIEKKARVHLVDKLCPIVLFDAVAHPFKHLGRCMKSLAETHKLDAPEQAGSRKFFQASMVALYKELTYDISRHLLQPMALCSNNAKSCYDQIVHSVASLSIQRTTLPKPPLVCMVTTIQKMAHYVRTVFGISSDYFGGERDFDLFAIPMQLICQGNGAGPQIWALVSTPVLNLMRLEGYGFLGRDLSLLGMLSLTMPTLGFHSRHYDQGSSISRQMQDAVTAWSDGLSATSRQMQDAVMAWSYGLSATGGAQAPQKSFWYLVDDKWKQGVGYPPPRRTYRQIYATPRSHQCLPTGSRWMHIAQTPGNSQFVWPGQILEHGSPLERHVYCRRMAVSTLQIRYRLANVSASVTVPTCAPHSQDLLP